MTEANSTYERAVVLYHSAKTRERRFRTAQKQISHLGLSFDLPIEELRSDPDKSVTQSRLLKLLKQRDLLLVIGGDGMLNTAARALVRQDKDARAHLLSAGGGTANDFSRNRNGKLTGADALTNVLMNGKPVEIRPMAIDINGGREQVALNNAGFHYTANFAQMIDEASYRGSVLRRIPVIGEKILDVATVVRSMRNLDTVPIFVPDRTSPDAVPTDIVDLSLVHAREAAKLGNFPSDHESSEFFCILNTWPSPISIAMAGVDMVRGTTRGVHFEELTFDTGDLQMMGHVDGEVFRVAPFSSVDIQLIEQESAITVPSLNHI